ncbi:hypothetical protein ACFXK0_19875 [Nocardia sp. NPDC059177]|uniref:hypothetical protein n=1 Tax=Nocardia sp. NPDC059177 TaxID=3346759 RepID=UPI0036A6B25E
MPQRTDRLYYRGYRIADGATIDLYDVSRRADGGFVAVNAPDNARYEISSDGFQLIQNGTVVVSESAVAVGPGPDPGSLPTPSASSAPTVVLGAAMGPTARGYGSEHPTAISLGSCANLISEIVWTDWGAPTAHGNGRACVQFGEPPQYPLVASNIGMCQGVPAYRTLQISTNPPQDICGG